MLRIDELVGGGPAAGSYATVRDGGLAPTTGIITVSPAFSAAVQAGTDYSLWKVCHPSVAERALNRVLRRLRREMLIPISVLANGGLDTDTVNWSPVTATLTTTALASRVKHGAGAMQMVAAGGTPSATSESVQLTRGEQVILAAYVRALAGTVTMNLLDGGSNNISGANASTAVQAFQELVAGGGYVTVPDPVAGNELVSVRFSGAGGTDQHIIDSVVLWPAERKWFDLPSYVEDPADVVGVGYYPQGRQLAGTNAYQVDEERWTPWPYTVARKYIDEGGAHPFQLELRTPVIRPLFVRLRRPFAELTTDTATTTADRELTVQLTLREIYRVLRALARNRKDQASERQWDEAISEVSQHAAVQAWEHRFGEREMAVVTPSRRSRRI